MMEVMNGQFVPNTNKRAERYKFNNAVQREGEPISEFIVRLKTLAKDCKFGDLDAKVDKSLIVKKVQKGQDGNQAEIEVQLDGVLSLLMLDGALTDRFIVGLNNQKIQQKLLDADDLNFEGCCAMALNMEKAQHVSKRLQPNQEFMTRVNAAQSHTLVTCPSKAPGKERTFSDRATWTKHFELDKDLRNNLGAIKSLGRDKFRVQREAALDEKPLETQLDIEGQKVTMEVDSGSCATVMSQQEYDEKYSSFELYKVTGKKSTFKLLTGECINTLGVCNVRVYFGGGIHLLSVFVLPSDQYFRALLGRPWLNVLCPEWRNFLSKSESSESINLQLEESQDLLKINTLKGLFAYTRMVFGIKHCPSFFQNVMDRIMAGMERVICYMGDTC